MTEKIPDKSVVIVGRPNVGKSTLFNRLVGRRHAIVAGTSGVTRDRVYGRVQWGAKSFRVIDTGGIIPEYSAGLNGAIKEQAVQAVQEASLILFVVDGQCGPQAMDEDVRRFLFELAKPVFLVVNKVDDPAHDIAAMEFYSFGYAEVFPVSAQHGLAIDVLLDEIERKLELTDDRDGTGDDADIPRIALLGKPNAGKSSLLNYLLQKDRVIVDNVPGTTRDSIDEQVVFEGTELILIDTAGLRQKKKMQEHLDVFSRSRTIESVRRAQICIVVVDATKPFVNDDIHLLTIVREFQKPCVVAINKSDLMPIRLSDCLRVLKERAPFLEYALCTVCSAHTGHNVNQLLRLCLQAWEHAGRRYSQKALNEFLHILRTDDKLALLCGGMKVHYVHQLKGVPPELVLIVNRPERVSAAALKYIERSFRKNFETGGVPLRFTIKKKEKKKT